MTEFGMAPLNDWAGTVASLSNDGANADDIEHHLGRKIAVARHYNPAGDFGMNHDVMDHLNAGRKVYVEVAAPWKTTTDAQMQAFADAHKAFADRIYVVPQHEPDAETGYGASFDFKAWFVRFSKILRATADFTIVANQTRNAFHTARGTWTPPLDSFDLFGLDGYNTGKSAWRSFSDLFTEGRAYAGSIGKPFCVGETGCVEGAPGQKAKWFADQGAWLVDSDVAFVCYSHHFNGKGANYTVTTSPESAAAFITLAQSPAYAGGVVVDPPPDDCAECKADLVDANDRNAQLQDQLAQAFADRDAAKAKLASVSSGVNGAIGVLQQLLGALGL